MQKTVEATQRSFNTIRTGRANATLLDRVVEYWFPYTPRWRTLASRFQYDYGSSRMIVIPEPNRKGDFPVGCGFNPNNDGMMIRLNIPH